jgi:hypothetical protein
LDALRCGLRVPGDNLQKLLAHEAVVLGQFGEAGLDRSTVNVVDDLVADLADDLAKVREITVGSVKFP